jgi:hypothetical protein
MTKDNAFRGLLSSLPTYLQRDGAVCTTCGASSAAIAAIRSDTPPGTRCSPPLWSRPGAKGSTDAPPSDH